MEERNLTPTEKMLWHQVRSLNHRIDGIITEVIDLMLMYPTVSDEMADFISRNYQYSSAYNHGEAEEWLLKEIE